MTDDQPDERVYPASPIGRGLLYGFALSVPAWVLGTFLWWAVTSW